MHLELIDLSKTFDCLPHELLITKLDAYGVDIPSLKLLHSYLTKRKQRVKLNGTYNSWSKVLFGVLQGSIIGPLLFNIFPCDLFQFFPDVDIANYADDNTPHSSNKNLNKVLHDLKKIQILYSNGLLIIFWRETQKNHIFLRTQHKKFKLTSVKLQSPTVNAKSFWVSILIINWHLSPM